MGGKFVHSWRAGSVDGGFVRYWSFVSNGGFVRYWCLVDNWSGSFVNYRGFVDNW